MTDFNQVGLGFFDEGTMQFEVLPVGQGKGLFHRRSEFGAAIRVDGVIPGMSGIGHGIEPD